MDFIWTDELVLEFCLANSSPTKKDIEKFKQVRKILPINGLIKTVSIDGNILEANFDMCKMIAHEYYNPKFQILSCESNGFLFNINDIIYDGKMYSKYGGKLNSYVVEVKSFNLRIKKDNDGNVLSSLLLVNNFHDISNFIKK